MINNQMDVYFIEGNRTKGYKTEYATKVGIIWPPNPQFGSTMPNLDLKLVPSGGGMLVVLPKGMKPKDMGQGQPPMQQPQSQPPQHNTYQQAKESGGQTNPYWQGDPGPSSDDIR
ncbi:MAG: hypothetical protein Tp172SUR151031_19 [Prokaryotic dsDNA virus sp.]|nr:MAG: hypothetical protein Tp172SUR151031_19 [Prokaryotic dsDNA virus sp.]|tara:strand:- start:10561 stop:10905 length:345 start_codon:yes stop_codon:yes gene_type:complete